MACQVTVKTRFGEYPVVIGAGLDYGKLAAGVKKPCRVVIVSDDNVFPLYGESALESFRAGGYETSVYILKNGEQSKNLSVIADLLDFLAKENITRSDALAALGGGVVGDISGFAAAVYLRGIDYFQLPTTVLAAVDSSVGGKTGVDLSAGKNLAGAFHQPAAVFCDTNVFASLPKEVYSGGMAEVIKHGMIADRDMLVSLDKLPADEMCARNVRIKAAVVEEDEFDTGKRMLLNFGHTVGHAIEKASAYRVSHGYAVAAGMIVVTRASEKMGLTESPCLDDLRAALSRYGLPVSCDYGAKTLAEAALRDKKRMGAAISLIVPRKTGRAEIHNLPVGQLEDFIEKGLTE